MFLCDIVDKLLDEHGLADSRSTEKSDLSALQIWLKQVNDLDAGEQHLLGSRQVIEFWRLAMNRESAFTVKLAHSVDGFTHNIHHSSTNLRAYRHCDRRTRTHGLHSTFEAIS